MNAGKKIVVQRWRKECRDKVKSKVHTLDIAPLHETPPQKCSTQVLNVFSRISVLPAHPHVHLQLE